MVKKMKLPLFAFIVLLVLISVFGCTRKPSGEELVEFKAITDVSEKGLMEVFNYTYKTTTGLKGIQYFDQDYLQ